LIDISYERLRNNLDFGVYFIAINLEDNTQMGMCMITYEYNIMFNNTRSWLQSVFVKPEFRKQGVFKFLLQNVEDYIRINSSKFYQSLVLYADNDNERAITTYFKLGFKENNCEIIEKDFIFSKISLNLEERNNLSVSYASEEGLVELKEVLNANSLALDASTYDKEDNSFSFVAANDIETLIKGIGNIISNKNLGKVLFISDYSGIIAIILIHFEFSDWRNNLFWYIYKIILVGSYAKEDKNEDTNLNYKEVKEILTPIVDKIVEKGEEDKECCGVRFALTNPINTLLLNSKNIEKSHYLILEKIIS